LKIWKWDMEQIPVIDYEDLRFMRTKAIEDIGQGFCKTGFAFIGSPEVTRLLPRIFKEFKNLFGLPYEIKAGYERKDIFRQRGWTPPYTEQAIACRKTGNNREDVPDAKEGWFMGPDRRTGLDMTNPVIHTHPHQYHPNVWPKEVPTFEYRMRQLYAHLLNPDSQLLGPGMSVMKALEHYLGKPLGYFEEMIKNAPTVLRAIHYPPIKPGEVDEIQWACKHTDINLVTILPASTKQGLWRGYPLSQLLFGPSIRISI